MNMITVFVVFEYHKINYGIEYINIYKNDMGKCFYSSPKVTCHCPP